MKKNRQEEIRQKGFRMADGRRSYYSGPVPLNNASIKIGKQTLQDAILDLGYLKKVNGKLGNKHLVLKALWEKDLDTLREISNYFYRTNGIYFRVVNSFATLFRYDWYVAPEVTDEKIKEDKILEDFTKVLGFLDESEIAETCAEMALEVLINGAYYGYLTASRSCIALQQLPIRYCRSRFKVNGRPAVEFNMKFFDEEFKDPNYRLRVLDLFPAEFKKGYLLYKQGKLPKENATDTLGSWYLLEPGRTIKFSFYNGDMPLFANAIPSIIDLDAAQDLDRRKQMQQLLKILIQKLPMDKNGDLIFDIDEAKDIHDNAVAMTSNAIGVDVLTTFADIQVESLSDKSTTTTTDDLEKIERTVYNSLGMSRNLFNTDGNLSLEKSILNDEGVMRPLILQFETFYNKITRALGSAPKKYKFRFYMLGTTQYNYKDLAKIYKEQTQIGYSKMLPQIALGHSQSSILNAAHFENEVLKLSELMLPPMSSNVMNAESLTALGDKNSGNGKMGRPKKEDSQKAEKTILNEESKS
jgi:hypothetical protein